MYYLFDEKHLSGDKILMVINSGSSDTTRRSETKKKLYSTYRLLDNILSGISRDVVEYDRKLLEVEFSFRFDDCHMLILGYKKAFFQQFTRTDATMMKFSDAMKEIVAEAARRLEISYDILYLNPDKYWCLLFSSPKGNREDQALVFSRELTERFNDFYQRNMPDLFARYLHCSALSGPIRSYKDIAGTCDLLRLRKELSFFCNETCVLTDSYIAEQSGPYTYDSLSSDIEQFRTLLQKRDASLPSLLEELCLKKSEAPLILIYAGTFFP